MSIVLDVADSSLLRLYSTYLMFYCIKFCILCLELDVLVVYFSVACGVYTSLVKFNSASKSTYKFVAYPLDVTSAPIFM